MIIRVKAYAKLKQLSQAETEINLKTDSTLEDLFNSEHFSKKLLEQIIDKSGNIRPSILILRNGRNIMLSRGLQTKLEDGDNLSLFPSMSGG